jgi:hypothetical protein
MYKYIYRRVEAVAEAEEWLREADKCGTRYRYHLAEISDAS